MENKKINHIYPIVLEDDKSLKQFIERFYVLPREPKDSIYTEKQIEFLEQNSLVLTEKLEIEGKDGFIVYRKKKKFKPEEVERIKNEPGSYREKAKKYNVSLGTIYKIMRDKY